MPWPTIGSKPEPAVTYRQHTVVGTAGGACREPGTTAPASPTRSESLSDAIADAILSGDFAPGTHLDGQILVKRSGVSRTPVRDALRRLNGTGLIDGPALGFAVTPTLALADMLVAAPLFVAARGAVPVASMTRPVHAPAE